MKATAPLHPPVRSSPPPPSTDDGRKLRLAPRVSYRRAYLIGLGLSLVFHILILLIAWRTRLVPVPAVRPYAPVVAMGGERSVMRVERIVVVPDAPAGDEAPEPVEREERQERETEPGFEVDAGGAEAAPAPAPSALERLRPRMGDPRLWTRPELPPPEEPSVSDIERVRARIAQRVREFNDSVAIEAARAADAMDWTVVDGEGKRWGVSPGKIHLGDLTLPLPINLGGTPSARREQAEERARREAEIAAQAERAAVEEFREDRIRAIRERKDQDRRDRRGAAATAGSGNGAGSTGSSTSGAGSGSGTGSGGDTGKGSGGGTGSGSGGSGGSKPGGNGSGGG